VPTTATNNILSTAATNSSVRCTRTKASRRSLREPRIVPISATSCTVFVNDDDLHRAVHGDGHRRVPRRRTASRATATNSIGASIVSRGDEQHRVPRRRIASRTTATRRSWRSHAVACAAIGLREHPQHRAQHTNDGVRPRPASVSRRHARFVVPAGTARELRSDGGVRRTHRGVRPQPAFVAGMRDSSCLPERRANLRSDGGVFARPQTGFPGSSASYTSPLRRTPSCHERSDEPHGATSGGGYHGATAPAMNIIAPRRRRPIWRPDGTRIYDRIGVFARPQTSLLGIISMVRQHERWTSSFDDTSDEDHGASTPTSHI
jgi:hypothetical protein